MIKVKQGLENCKKKKRQMRVEEKNNKRTKLLFIV